MTSSHKDRQDNPRTKTTKIKCNTEYSNYTLSQFGFQDGTKFSATSVSKHFVDVLCAFLMLLGSTLSSAGFPIFLATNWVVSSFFKIHNLTEISFYLMVLSKFPRRLCNLKKKWHLPFFPPTFFCFLCSKTQNVSLTFAWTIDQFNDTGTAKQSAADATKEAKEIKISIRIC